MQGGSQHTPGSLPSCCARHRSTVLDSNGRGTAVTTRLHVGMAYSRQHAGGLVAKWWRNGGGGVECSQAAEGVMSAGSTCTP